MGCCDLHDNTDYERLNEQYHFEREARKREEEYKRMCEREEGERRLSEWRQSEGYKKLCQILEQRKKQQQLLYQRRLNDKVIQKDIESRVRMDGSIPRFIHEFRIDEGFTQNQLNEMAQIYRKVGEALGFRMEANHIYSKTNSSLKKVGIRGWKWPYVEGEA